MNVEPSRIPAVGSPPTALADFDAYVAARGADLYRTAYLLTGGHHLAEDLVQTALSKAWPHWEKVTSRPDPSPHAYVRRILLTTYIAWWRRRWNDERPTQRLPDRPAGTTMSANSDSDRVATRHDLAAALATLPRGQRAVIVLRYYDDLTEAQTAAALGCSVGAVKSQTSRALAKLRASTHLIEEGAQP